MEFGTSISFSGNTISFSPLTLSILLVALLAILFGPRKWVLPVFLTVSLVMSISLHFMILGQNFMIYRVLLLCAWGRLLMRGEHHGLRLSPMDKALMFFAGWLVVSETLQWQIAGLNYGFANYVYDGMGTYFLCRILLREANDLRKVVACLAGICVVFAAFMCVEFVTGHNWMTVLGAVQDVTQERSGRLRCAASFSIPITGGTFGAVLFPLFVGCWWQGRELKKWAVPGCVASTIIVLASGSATPLSSYALGIVGLLAWPYRRHLRTFRWGLVFTLLGLHLVMKAPVWALLGRISIVPGSSSHHRYLIIDAFLQRIDQWWLIGVKSTADWGWMADDLANQFCVFAKHGGMLGLFLFIRLFVLGFREVGAGLREASDQRPTGLMTWAFGVMLFTHCVSFFGISYYDQTRIIWYASLGMIASVRLLIQPSTEATEPASENKAGAQNAFGLKPGISPG